MTPALSREERDAIRARAERAADYGPGIIARPGWQSDLCASQADVPALLDALDAAEEENERLRVHLDDATRSRGDWAAAELAQRGRAEHAETALAALRGRIEGLAERYENTSTDRALRPRYDVIAARLRDLAADDEGGRAT